MLSEDLILLKIIDVGGSTNLLIKRGLSYSQIVMKIEKQIELGNVAIDDTHRIYLTEAGIIALKEGLEKAQLSGKETWILPQEQYYNTPIDEHVIILPKKI